MIMINYMTLKYRILHPKCYSLSEMKFYLIECRKKLFFEFSRRAATAWHGGGVGAGAFSEKLHDIEKLSIFKSIHFIMWF